MSMSKKDFICTGGYAQDGSRGDRWPCGGLHFMRDRWLDYIAGKCGKNGGER